ncbi:MAG: glycosyltransferase family 2 protein [Muribaculaceae bacterium]|nr:glycosyltransferase family 2 protein [Muribaculaceae bacterium]
MISIITTIYKAEKYLPRLLDSMMALKSPDLEFFLIDNGSPDSCGEICAEYAKKDSRFFLYCLKENIGYIKARMLGIRECHGEYVGFCDSDDFLEPGGYDKAFQIIKEQDCDLYITAHKTHFDEVIQFNLPPFTNGTYEGEAIINGILPQAFGFLKGRERLHGFMWKQIYRKSILCYNGFTLNENLKPWEDQVLNIDMIQHCERIVVDDTVIYNYFANSGSVTSSMITDFDAEGFWRNVKALYLEKSKRAHFRIERRANANSAVYLMDLMVVSLCKDKSLSSANIVTKLSELLSEDNVAHEVYSLAHVSDMNNRLRLVKNCLRFHCYRLLVGIIRHKLKKPR